jgi:hypothetical protein
VGTALAVGVGPVRTGATLSPEVAHPATRMTRRAADRGRHVRTDTREPSGTIPS